MSMKKIASLVLILMLCVSASAAPSKTTADTSSASISEQAQQYSEADATAVLEVVTDPTSQASQNADAALADLLDVTTAAASEGMTEAEAAQAQSEAIVEYFQSNGNTITTAEGDTTTLAEVLIPAGSTGTVSVDEVFAIDASGFADTVNDPNVIITTTFNVASQEMYSADEKVAVVVGLTRPDGSIEWIVLEGVFNGEGIEVDIPGNLVARIQSEGGATIAIASADLSA